MNAVSAGIGAVLPAVPAEEVVVELRLWCAETPAPAALYDGSADSAADWLPGELDPPDDVPGFEMAW